MSSKLRQREETMSRAGLTGASLVVVGLLIPACVFGQDMKSQAQAAADRWDQSFNQKDAQSLARGYAPDAVVLPAGGPALKGPDNIQKFFADVIGKGFSQHKVNVDSAEPKGNVVIAYGSWQAIGPDQKQYQGHWTNVLERQGDQWRTVLHTWN
jgi:ketosteroid isomerase-like protein